MFSDRIGYLFSDPLAKYRYPYLENLERAPDHDRNHNDNQYPEPRVADERCRFGVLHRVAVGLIR